MAQLLPINRGKFEKKGTEIGSFHTSVLWLIIACKSGQYQFESLVIVCPWLVFH